MSLGPPSNPDSSTSGGSPPAFGGPFEVGDWLVEPDLLRIRQGDETRKLEPMAMRLLVFLAERPAVVTSRAEILEQVWEGRSVVDETLSRGMSLVRQALGDNAQKPTYIETIPKRGYRLIAAVRPPGDPPGESSARDRSIQRPEGSGAPATGAGRWRLAAALALPLALLALWQIVKNRQPPGPDVALALPDSALPGPGPSASAFPDSAPQSRTTDEEQGRPGIAVMPFKNLSPDPSNAYLADGLTEELIHQLASVSGLRVVSRTSSMHFRNSKALAPEIAQALSVDYLLEGTVLVVGHRLRITAQLIRPDQDDHLLSRSYDRELSEVLDLQREVAKDVAEQTRTQLSPTETIRLSRDRPVSSDAYRTYLQGRQLIQGRSDLGRGLELLERATRLDPGFAPAWSALADAYLLGNSYTGRSEESAYGGAEAAIGRALELDPELAAAHASLGLLHLQRDRDWPGSEASYHRAIALEPSYVTARQWYSELLSFLGRHGEALEQVNIALELDPLSPLVHAAAGQRLNAAGRHQEALGRLRDAEALGAEFSWHLREASWALIRLGRVREALEMSLEAATRREPDGDPSIAQLEREMGENGMDGYHAWELERLLTMTEMGPGYPTWLAAAYAGTGQTEEALEWLARAAEMRNLWLLHTLRSPAFDTLRDDPRFEEALGDLSSRNLRAADTGQTP